MILAMTKNHIDEVCKLEVELFDDPWEREVFYNDLESNIAHFFVYQESTKVNGYVGGNIVLDELSITNVAVGKEYQRCGIGRKLVQFILDYAKNRDCVKAFLEVKISNASAILLYQSLGFQKIGIRKNYYQIQDNKFEDAIVMLKKI